MAASAGGSSSLASLYVEFTTRGLNLVNNQIGALGKAIGPLHGQLTQLNSQMTQLAAAASPVAINTFTGSLQILAASIGQAFVPMLMKTSFLIQDLADWFQNLSKEQAEHITRWGMIIAGASAATLIFTKLAPVLSLLLSGVKLLTGAMSLLGVATGGMLIPLGLIAGILLAIGGAVDEAGGGMGGLNAVFKDVMQGLKPIFDSFRELFVALKPVLSELALALKDLFVAVAPLFQKIGELVLGLLKPMIPVLTWLVKALTTVVGWVDKIFTFIRGVLIEVKEWAINTFGNKEAKQTLAEEKRAQRMREQNQEQYVKEAQALIKKGVEDVSTIDEYTRGAISGNKKDRRLNERGQQVQEEINRQRGIAGNQPPPGQQVPGAPKKRHLIARPRNMQATLGGIGEAWKRIQLDYLNRDDLQRRMLELQQKGDERAREANGFLADIAKNTSLGLL
jgi:hypothetical protein